MAHVPAYAARASSVYAYSNPNDAYPDEAAGNTNSDANTDHDTNCAETVRNPHRKSACGCVWREIAPDLVERQHVKLRALCSRKCIDGYKHARFDIHAPARDDHPIHAELQLRNGGHDFRTDHRNSALMSKGGMIYCHGMKKKKTEIQELSEFIRDNMVTRKEFHEEITPMKNDIRRIEMKVDSIDKRLDYELDHRKQLEVRITKLEKKVHV